MNKILDNKVVAVTGAARGIGYNIALQFLKNKAKNVIILDIDEVEGEKAANALNDAYGEGKANFFKCDVTKDLDEISKKIFDKYTYVDVLVNNAGTANESSARETLELNAIALIEWSMKFWEHMRTDKGGKGGTILNIGSIYSYIVNPFLVFYKASKFAVRGFTRSLGHESNYRKFGVRLIVIYPGFTHSELTERQLCWDEHLEEFEEYTSYEPWQSCEEVGVATVTIFENGNSGTAWSIIGGKLTEEDK